MKLFHLLLPVATLLAPTAGFCQTATLSLASATAAAGSAVSLNLSLTNAASLGSLSTLQFSITYTAAEFSSVSIAAGAAATSKSKSLKCQPSAGRLNCVVWGINQTSLTDGVVASVTATTSTSSASTSRTLAVTGVLGAQGAGSLTSPIAATNGVITISAPASTLTLSNLTCNPSTVNSQSSTICTVSLSANTPSAATISITRNTSRLSAPSSVTIGAGQSSTTFTVTTGTFTTNSTGVVTATWNGVSRNFSLSLIGLPTLQSFKCTPSVLNPSNTTSCLVQLSRAVTAPTEVSITRNGSRLTVPSTVTVQSGLSSAEFVGTALAVTSLSQVLVHATLNSVRVTTTVFVSAQSCPCSVWDPTTAVPTVLSSSDTSAVELGTKFRAKLDGYILGLRFYKGPGNTGTHSGRLWTAGGAQLASVTFANETPSGWQQAFFAAPVPIYADTTYVISYRAPVGRYSLNEGYFTAAGVDRGPLAAPKSGDFGGNGVYRYGSIAFPTSTFNASNYWVDVIFNTQPSTGTTAIPLGTGSPLDRGVTISSFSVPDSVEVSEETDPGSEGPAISVPDKEFLRPGERFSFIAATSDGQPVIATGLPTGATLDRHTQRFEWTPEPNHEGDHVVAFHGPDNSAVAETHVVVGSGTPEVISVGSCLPGATSLLRGKWLAPDADEHADASGNSLELAGVRVRIEGELVPVLRASRSSIEFACPALALTEGSVLVETPAGSVSTRLPFILEK